MAAGKLPPVFPDDDKTPVAGTPIAPPPEISPVIVAAAAINMRRKPAHARNHGHTTRVPRIIVIHATDGHEGPTKDFDVASMFAREDLKPRRSCHYVVDTDSVTQCVPDELEAWHCGRTGNDIGIGIELCGRANQTHSQWHDSLSLPMLRIAARLVAELCRKHSIPCVYLTSKELRSGHNGVTTHSSVSIAWNESTHTDPGKDFPMVKLVNAARSALGLST